MQSIGDIARRDGVSKPTVSIAVKRLIEQHGLAVERDGQGRVSLVNVAQYDHLRGRYGDPSKAQAPTKAAPIVPGHLNDLNSYDEALRQKTWHEAERRRLELAEMKGRLVRVDRLQIGVAACGEAIAQAIDRLPQHANDLAISVAKDGEHGLRTALKKIAAKMRDDVATALMAVAADAPATDPATDDDGAGGAKGPA